MQLLKSCLFNVETSCVGLFAGDDSLAGANFCARTALDASIGIDVVDVAFRDSVNGTNGLASAASHARVSNNVSHDRLILVLVDNLYEKFDVICFVQSVVGVIDSILSVGVGCLRPP